MDAGQVDTALKTLARAERLTKGKQPRIVAEASTARHRTLLLAGRLEEAAAAEFPAAARVAAIRRHAEELEKSNPAGAVALWQTLLEDPGLHGVRVQSNELLATAGQLAEDRIGLLIKTHGTKVYEGAEKRARALRENAKGAERDRAAGAADGAVSECSLPAGGFARACQPLSRTAPIPLLFPRLPTARRLCCFDRGGEPALPRTDRRTFQLDEGQLSGAQTRSSPDAILGS